MILLCVLVFPPVLALIAIHSVKHASRRGSDEVDGDEDVVGQLGKGAEAEINPTTRQSCHELHEHCSSQAEKSYVKVDEHPRARMLQNMPEEVSRYHDEAGNNTLDPILWQPDSSPASTSRSVTEPAKHNGVIHGNSDLHCPSQAEKSYGEEDEHPRAHMLQNTPEELPNLSAASTSRSVTVPAEHNGVIHGNSDLREGREEERRRETEAEEEIKSTLKFCYFSTGISVAGNIGIFSGYLGDQTGHAHTVPLKICTMFMLTTFVSGSSMLVLIFLRRSIRISIKFFRSLKYTTFVFLTLSMFSVSILFLKMFAILAFIPTLFIVTISFIMGWHSCCRRQGQRGMSYRILSLPV